MVYWTHHLDPVFFKIGDFRVTYYLAHFFVCYAIGMFCTWRLCKEGLVRIPTRVAMEMYWGVMPAIVIGARLGEAILFLPKYYLEDLSRLFQVWNGGFAFQGATAMTVVFLWVYAKIRKLDPYHLNDIIVTGVPGAIFVGRIANFINAECVGRVTDVSWAVIFPKHGMVPRHPSQLYEAIFEGEILFLILWLGRKRLRTPGHQTGMFLVCYGAFRFIIEFFREPYAGQLVSVFGLGVSQLLCLVMFVIGVWLFARSAPNFRRSYSGPSQNPC